MTGAPLAGVWPVPRELGNTSGPEEETHLLCHLLPLGEGCRGQSRNQSEKVLAAHAWDSGGLDTDRDRDVGKSGGF